MSDFLFFFSVFLVLSPSSRLSFSSLMWVPFRLTVRFAESHVHHTPHSFQNIGLFLFWNPLRFLTDRYCPHVNIRLTSRICNCVLAVSATAFWSSFYQTCILFTLKKTVIACFFKSNTSITLRQIVYPTQRYVFGIGDFACICYLIFL